MDQFGNPYSNFLPMVALQWLGLSLLARRHHCRYCGGLVCDNCSRPWNFAPEVSPRSWRFCHKRLISVACFQISVAIQHCGSSTMRALGWAQIEVTSWRLGFVGLQESSAYSRNRPIPWECHAPRAFAMAREHLCEKHGGTPRGAAEVRVCDDCFKLIGDHNVGHSNVTGVGSAVVAVEMDRCKPQPKVRRCMSKLRTVGFV